MRAPLATFFALTFVATWTLWALAAALPAGGTGESGLRALLFLPGTFFPAAAALWVTSRAEGRAGTRALLDRLFIWDVGARWYVLALGYMLGIKALAAVTVRAMTGEWPVFGTTPVVLMLGATLLSTPAQAGEEIGWRGFALPRLAERFGLPIASILLGVIWALWHLPLFFIVGTSTTGQSFPVYLVGVTALSVALAWMHWRTRGSLLLVMLMHAAVNNTRDLVPSASVPGESVWTFDASPVAWTTAALLWIPAAWMAFRMRDARRPATGA
jgi:membrane protease YdiL (CAAX protease family)